MGIIFVISFALNLNTPNSILHIFNNNSSHNKFVISLLQIFKILPFLSLIEPILPKPSVSAF